MDLKELIAKIRNTSPYENLNGILGKELGELLYKLVDEAEKVDQELDILHSCIRELYECDISYDTIKKTLDSISKVKSATEPKEVNYEK